MYNLIMYIGKIIRELRQERKMTLAELSKESGVALATLSRIENGRMTGTLHSHMKICEALEVALTDLYKGLSSGGKRPEVQSKNTRHDIVVRAKNVTSELLASKISDKKMMPVLLKINRGGVTHKEETKTAIEKFIYVLEGKIEAAIGEEKFNLAKGDTLYFTASAPHNFRNIGQNEAQLISVTSPPTL